MTPMMITKPNPRASACQSQPVMMRLRTASIMYETGFSVAAVRNQSTPMRFRGAFIEERKRKTKRTGKSAWIVSPEPVRYASQAPSAPNARATTAPYTSSTAIPAGPDSKRTPAVSPTAM